MTAHLEIITASAPHIYHSALVSTPKTSVVRKLYESYAQPFARVVCGLPASWDLNTATTKYLHKIEQAVWSPCGRFIAVAFQNTTLILDSVTLQKLQTLKFERQLVGNITQALCFSPDCLVLTRFGHHNDQSEWQPFVVNWDLQTGGVISVIERPPEDHDPGKAYITYSTNGKTVGVLYQRSDTTATLTTISIYNVSSGIYTHDVYHHATENTHWPTLIQPESEYPWCGIWTYGEFLRFTTVTPTGASIWEVEFVPGATLTEVGSLPFPDDMKPAVLAAESEHVNVQFHPALHRLFLFRSWGLGGLLVWDAREFKTLLHCTNIEFTPQMTFSSDGRLFACPTFKKEVYLWKESSTGYVLHGMFTPSDQHIPPLLSPNGELLFTHDGSITRLWHTNSFTAAPSTTLLPSQRIENFVLDFLLDRSLAVVARQGDDTVAILDLKPGVPRWTIDAGMRIRGLRVIGETIAVIGEERVTGWDFPGGTIFPGNRMGVKDSIFMIPFRRKDAVAASISFDLGYIAFINRRKSLEVYNTSAGTNTFFHRFGSALWFLPDSHDIGLLPNENRAEVQIITTQDTVLKKMPLGDIEYGQWGCPYGSSRGYKFTNNGWIISPSGQRLLMLPPHWQADLEGRVWSGQFLALLHGTLSEVVILELEPPPKGL